MCQRKQKVFRRRFRPQICTYNKTTFVGWLVYLDFIKFLSKNIPVEQSAMLESNTDGNRMGDGETAPGNE